MWDGALWGHGLKKKTYYAPTPNKRMMTYKYIFAKIRKMYIINGYYVQFFLKTSRSILNVIYFKMF